MDYPAQTWAVIRELYESTPAGFSIEKIRKKAKEFLGETKIPSREAISYQTRQKKWQKHAHKQTTLDNEQLALRIQELSNMSEQYQQNLSNQATKALVNMHIDVDNAKLYQHNLFEQRKSAQVIYEHRKRSYQAGLMLDDAVSKLQKQMDILLDFPRYYEKHPDEFLGMDLKDAHSSAIRVYDKLVSTINAVESVGRSVGMLAKIDFVLYGLNPEDTRESESQKRITGLMSDDEYYKKRQAMLQDEGERIAKRMAMIQSGQMEEDIRQEMVSIAKQGNDDDEVFDEIL